MRPLLLTANPYIKSRPVSSLIPLILVSSFPIAFALQDLPTNACPLFLPRSFFVPFFSSAFTDVGMIRAILPSNHLLAILRIARTIFSFLFPLAVLAPSDGPEMSRRASERARPAVTQI